MKFFKTVLPLLLILCLLTACSSESKGTESLASSYLTIAQNYIDQGDLQAAKDTLVEGFQLTNDPDIAVMLAQLQTDGTADETPTTETPVTEAPTTEAPTTEAPTEAPTIEASTTEEETARVGNSGDLTRDFTSTDWYRINLFLSNFSELGFSTLNHNDAYSLVNFAYLHTSINNPNALDYVSGASSYLMSTSHTDQTLYRFFGHTVEHGNHTITYPSGYTNTIEYSPAGYYFPPASGEFNGYLTIIDSMYDRGDGTYNVYFDVYSLDYDLYYSYGISSDYYYLTADDVYYTNELTYCYSGQAVVRDYDGGSYQSYQLVEYDVG